MPDIWQSYERMGYRAKVSVEWSAPDDIELLPQRAADATGIAEEALMKLIPTPMELVAAMIGRNVR